MTTPLSNGRAPIMVPYSATLDAVHGNSASLDIVNPTLTSIKDTTCFLSVGIYVTPKCNRFDAAVPGVFYGVRKNGAADRDAAYAEMTEFLKIVYSERGEIDRFPKSVKEVLLEVIRYSYLASCAHNDPHSARIFGAMLIFADMFFPTTAHLRFELMFTPMGKLRIANVAPLSTMTTDAIKERLSTVKPPEVLPIPRAPKELTEIIDDVKAHLNIPKTVSSQMVYVLIDASDEIHAVGAFAIPRGDADTSPPTDPTVYASGVQSMRTLYGDADLGTMIGRSAAHCFSKIRNIAGVADSAMVRLIPYWIDPFADDIILVFTPSGDQVVYKAMYAIGDTPTVN